MSIRLRLALWYGVLTGLVLTLMAVFSYALHSRGHYDDLDRILINASEHAAADIEIVESVPHLSGDHSSTDTVLRLYDVDENLLQTLPDVSGLPPLSPIELLQRPDTSAYDPVAGLGPRMVNSDLGSEDASLQVITADEQRWRIYT